MFTRILVQRASLVFAVIRFEVVKGFRRTTLGILWQLPGHFIFIVGIGMISSSIFGTPFSERLTSGSLGYLGFTLMSGPILNSSSYQFRFPILETSAIPAHLKSAAGVSIHLLDFLIASIVLLPLAIGIGDFLSPRRITMVLIVVLSAVPLLYGMGSLIALVNLRFRDTEPIVQIFGKLWFISLPVFWDETLLKSNSIAERLLVTWNPFGATVVNVRTTALGGNIIGWNLSIVLVAGLLMVAISLGAHYLMRNSIKGLLMLRL